MKLTGKIFLNKSNGQLLMIPDKRSILRKLKIEKLPDGLNKSSFKAEIDDKFFKGKIGMPPIS